MTDHEPTYTEYRKHLERGEPVCGPCQDRQRRVRRSAAADAAAGMPRNVPVEETREHVRKLLESGWTHRAISRAAGVHRDATWRIMHQKGKKYVHRHIHDKIVALELLPRVPDNVSAPLPDLVGTRRRVEGLMLLGWPLEVIAKASGIPVTTLGAVRDGRVADIPRGMLAGVTAATNKLGRTTPERVGVPKRVVEMVRNRALSENYISLLAWNDFDDPRERAKGVA